MTKQVFLGYRNVIGHLIKKPPIGHSLIEEFTDEVEEWCKNNMKGYVWPVYHRFDEVDENGKVQGYARWEFCFQNEDDIWLFKLFHVG